MRPCSHCLLPCGESDSVADESGRVFCCEGCRTVYGFISGEGLEDFYRRRRWDPLDSERAAPPKRVETAPFEELVRRSGEEAEMDVYIDGIRCASCVWLVEKVLSRTPGVSYARVNYATHKARVRWDARAVSLEKVLARIYSTGYAPKPYTESEQVLARKAETRELLVRFGTAAFLSCQLMIYSVALYAGYFQGMDPGVRRLLQIIAMGLTVPVVFYAGLPFLRSTLAGLRRFRFTMDALIVVGSGSAFFYSLYGMATGGEVYFDTAAMIITLVLLGRYLESQAKGRASETLERLAELSPKKATRVLLDDSRGITAREAIDASALGPGDFVEVKPGEKFPADGVVLSGESSADESFITGESRPVPKSPGRQVIGGSINRFGSLVFEVGATGRDTVLARIVQSVEDAQASRPAIQGLADRIVGIFVPAILLLAAATVALHLQAGSGGATAVMTGISVLVISCPCSLGLATPLAVLVFTGKASARGLLVKSGQTVESASLADHVIFDKTGTLTQGSLALRNVTALDSSMDEAEALRTAASVESRSEHGLGAAIVEAGGGGPFDDVSGFYAVPGRGVKGVVGGRQVFVGNRAFMEASGLDPADGGKGAELISSAEAKGDTVVFMGWEGAVRALFVISDRIRDDAGDAVELLKGAGISVSLVSGDHREATASAAGRTGIENFEAEASPERKRQIVAELQEKGHKVIMVGDGINDAPALTEAVVGVAVGRGTDIAMESGDVVLTRNDLRLVPWLVAISRGTLRVIRQNIFWSFFYNATAIPLAVIGILHPIVAAAAMAASSLFVVSNSLRIRSLGADRE